MRRMPGRGRDSLSRRRRARRFWLGLGLLGGALLGRGLGTGLGGGLGGSLLGSLLGACLSAGGALVHVEQARHRVLLEASTEPGVLRAFLELDDRVDQLEAIAELLLDCAEGIVEAQEFGVGDELEALVGVEPVDPQVFLGELAQGFDELGLVSEALLDDLQRCFFHVRPHEGCAR